MPTKLTPAPSYYHTAKSTDLQKCRWPAERLWYSQEAHPVRIRLLVVVGSLWG